MATLMLLAVRRPPRGRRDKVVVLVDDDPPTLRMLLRTLRDEPYTVLGTGDPRQALQWVAERRVDLILSDQRMPEMTGTELLARVNAASPKTTCVLVTGYADEVAGAGAIREVVAKPWDADALREKIRGWLEA